MKRSGISGTKAVQRQGHLYDLESITSSDPKLIYLKFKNFDITLSYYDVDEIITAIRANLAKITYDFPPEALPRIDVPNEMEVFNAK